MNHAVSDLLRIAGAGGGMEISAQKVTVNDLIRICGVASGTGARIVIRDAAIIAVNDKIRIAGVGQGCVLFSA